MLYFVRVRLVQIIFPLFLDSPLQSSFLFCLHISLETANFKTSEHIFRWYDAQTFSHWWPDRFLFWQTFLSKCDLEFLTLWFVIHIINTLRRHILGNRWFTRILLPSLLFLFLLLNQRTFLDCCDIHVHRWFIWWRLLLFLLLAASFKLSSGWIDIYAVTCITPGRNIVGITSFPPDVSFN